VRLRSENKEKSKKNEKKKKKNFNSLKIKFEKSINCEYEIYAAFAKTGD